MRAEQEVYEGLNTAAGVIALVGERIYPDLSAQDAPLPLIVFERTATEATATIHDGLPIASKVTLSVSAWAGTRLEAEQIGDEAQIALHSKAITSNRSSYFDADTGSYAAVIDFDVWEL